MQSGGGFMWKTGLVLAESGIGFEQATCITWLRVDPSLRFHMRMLWALGFLICWKAISNTPPKSNALKRFLIHVSKSHLEPFECLLCEAEANSCEKHSWFWPELGLNLSKHRNIANDGSLIKIPHANVMRARFSYWLESWFWCGGGMGKRCARREGEREKMGLVLGENGSIMGECWDGFGSSLWWKKWESRGAVMKLRVSDFMNS